MITPHLSHDWESGRRESVVRRLNMVLKTLQISLLGTSTAVLFVAPLLFNVAFQDKFHGGLVVLPWTLTYCAWFGTTSVAQNYLWCVERPGLSSVALLLGLIINIALNLLLLPRYGLEGAVWSVTVANFVTLVLIYGFSRARGMCIDRGTWLLSLALVALSFGAWVSLGTTIVVLVAAACSNQILSHDEKRQGARHWLKALKECGDCS